MNSAQEALFNGMHNQNVILKAASAASPRSFSFHAGCLRF